MKDFERITVLVEESGKDRNTLNYVRELARVAQTRQIELLNVVPSPLAVSLVAVPVNGSSYWVGQEIIQERDARIAAKREEIELMGREFLPNDAGYNVKTTILFGSPLYEALEHTMTAGTDLIVVGRNYAGDGKPDEHATMVRRITAKSACSVLVLPTEACELPRRILVPVRDSECSAHALETACGLAARMDSLVFAFNLFPKRATTNKVKALPGQEPHDFPETEAKEEVNRLRARIDNHGVNVEYVCRPDEDDMPATKMLEAIDQMWAHAVVIGARGRTGAAGVLLGKVTEKLIARASVPVLAVKKKGEMIGVLKAILELAKK
jgi:nucleotide-binding universal stress UspA family protein